MSRVVVLDAGPLGLVTNPRRSPTSAACATWLQSLLGAGLRVVLPEIADYEVRRELLRANKTKGIAHLDALGQLIEYLPIGYNERESSRVSLSLLNDCMPLARE